MSRPTPKAFAALLQDAVNEPGTLSQAYQKFHSYSLGNQLLAWTQCADRGLQPGPMATYPRWRALGPAREEGREGHHAVYAHLGQAEACRCRPRAQQRRRQRRADLVRLQASLVRPEPD